MTKIEMKDVDRDLLYEKLKQEKEKITQEIFPLQQQAEQKCDAKSQDLSKVIYTVEDFLHYHDRDFIEILYKRLFDREALDDEVAHHLHLLRSGIKSKTELLALLRFSPEGKRYATPILGIKKRYFFAKLFDIPKVGYLAKVLLSPLLFPRYMRRLNALEASLTERLNALEVSLMHYQVQQQDKETAQQLSQEAKKREIQQKQQLKEALFNKLYIEFEDAFRGSKELLQQRQGYYIPWVEQCYKKIQKPVLDIGCGRGEWLEVLSFFGIPSMGIDLNKEMVDQAQRSGATALYADALEYLESQDDASFSVISGFHIVEHLEFEKLVALLDAAHRVLAKGGMILFETPNPENLYVGACNFYTDPTHINPIPPITLEFLAKNRGFKEVSIERVHPAKDASYLSGENTEDVNALIYAATKAQDYAIIGYKL
jgi:O-antigen chain-terminating methyltransferase